MNNRDENTGKFTKGNTLAKKAKKTKEELDKIKTAIYDEAKGDPIVGLTLLLTRASEVSLPLEKYIRICEHLLPYYKSQKSKEPEIQNTKFDFIIKKASDIPTTAEDK